MTISGFSVQAGKKADDNRLDTFRTWGSFLLLIHSKTLQRTSLTHYWFLFYRTAYICTLLDSRSVKYFVLSCCIIPLSLPEAAFQLTVPSWSSRLLPGARSSLRNTRPPLIFPSAFGSILLCMSLSRDVFSKRLTSVSTWMMVSLIRPRAWVRSSCSSVPARDRKTILYFIDIAKSNYNEWSYSSLNTLVYPFQ